MFARKAYQYLMDWKTNRARESALLVEGARRVGKSTLVKEFGRNEYKTHLLIDFSVAPDDIKKLFETSRDDLDAFFSYLSAYYSVKFHEHDTLVIFDEVQLFPTARGFLKHLVADGRYDYVETGSLISIKRNIQGILIPSEEDAFELNPFDFEEFLGALGEGELAALLAVAAQNRKPLPDAIHRKAMRLFREYMLVGGMPQAVAKYVETKSFEDADRAKRGILNLYRNDIVRYAQGNESKIVSIFEEIPAQLSKHEKKFTLASLDKNARMRRYDDAFFWLQNAKIANLCYNATDPSVGLGLYRERPTLKCYMADTGLLVTQAFADRKTTPNQIYKAVLFDNLEINEGMLMENVVAQSLHASGRKLFFYSRSNRADTADMIEIDFLVTEESGKKAKVCPIEVKSSKRYSTTSLDKFAKKFGGRIGNQYIFHTGNIKADGKRIWMPLYLALWL